MVAVAATMGNAAAKAGVGVTSAGRPEWRAQKKHGTRDCWDEGVLQLAADHVLFTPADGVDESASTTVPYVHLTVVRIEV